MSLSSAGMHTQRFLTYAAVAGGLAWLAKVVVLAATDGAESAASARSTSRASASPIGSIGIVLRLLEHRPRWLRVTGAALAPFAFIVIFLALDGVLVPLTRDHVPDWAEVEAGVFTAAVLGLTAGTWALRSTSALRTSSA